MLIAAGLIHVGQNVFASLWATHVIRTAVSPRLWAHLHFAQFLFLVFAGLGYFTLSCRQERYFYYEALTDYLIGLAGFLIVTPIIAVLIVHRVSSPWISLWPGTLLALYGAALFRG